MSAAGDKFEIVEVCTRWHRSVDHKRFGDLADVLTEVVSLPTLAEQGAPEFDPATYLGRYHRRRDDIIENYPPLLDGLLTQHLVGGFVVTLDGDTAVCTAHSINVHITHAEPRRMVQHGNEYQFDLIRTPVGWRVRGRLTWVAWSWGDDSAHDVAAKQQVWSEEMNR